MNEKIIIKEGKKDKFTSRGRTRICKNRSRVSFIRPAFSCNSGVFAGKQDQKCLSSSNNDMYNVENSCFSSGVSISAKTKEQVTSHSPHN
jgi:hypothetical protein